MCPRSVTGLAKARSRWILNKTQLSHLSLRKAYPLVTSVSFSFQTEKKKQNTTHRAATASAKRTSENCITLFSPLKLSRSVTLTSPRHVIFWMPPAAPSISPFPTSAGSLWLPVSPPHHPPAPQTGALAAAASSPPSPARGGGAPPGSPHALTRRRVRLSGRGRSRETKIKLMSAPSSTTPERKNSLSPGKLERPPRRPPLPRRTNPTEPGRPPALPRPHHLGEGHGEPPGTETGTAEARRRGSPPAGRRRPPRGEEKGKAAPFYLRFWRGWRGERPRPEEPCQPPRAASGRGGRDAAAPVERPALPRGDPPPRTCAGARGRFAVHRGGSQSCEAAARRPPSPSSAAPGGAGGERPPPGGPGRGAAEERGEERKLRLWRRFGDMAKCHRSR